MESIPTMLSIKETAKKTNLSEWYIRKLVWNNQIAFVKTGKKYLINLEKFCDYLNNQA